MTMLIKIYMKVYRLFYKNFIKILSRVRRRDKKCTAALFIRSAVAESPIRAKRVGDR